MLNENRIKEADSNVRQYIEDGLLKKAAFENKVGEKISHKVTADALISLVRKKLAGNLLESYEEIKDQAMAAIKSDEIISSFDFERKKRSIIQYKTEEFEKHSKAKTSLQRAKEFILEMEKLLV